MRATNKENARWEQNNGNESGQKCAKECEGGGGGGDGVVDQHRWLNM